MTSSRNDQPKRINDDLFMLKRLMIMRSAVICDRHDSSGEFADQVHENLFDTMLEKPSKKVLKKEQKQVYAHPEILAEIDKQRDRIIKKILYDIAHQDLEALKPKHFIQLIQDLCQLETDKQMLAYLEEFSNVKDERGKKAVTDFQIDFLTTKLYQQSSIIPDGKITDNKALEYLVNLGYQDLIRTDENNQRYIKQSDLGSRVIEAIRKNGLTDGGAQAFRVLQIMTYTNNVARETANVAQHQKKNDAASENTSSPAWKQKDKTTLASLFPVDEETADLKRRAQSLPSSQKEIEQHLNRIEREALLDELEKYENRSPKAKKRFMDKNADAIIELYLQLEKQGYHKAKNEFESYLTEYFIKPVQESIMRQADKLIDTLQTAILNDTVDDKLLAKISRTMTKIIKNLGESAETEKLMEVFSALMVKAHEVNENKAAFRQEVMALADEIMKHVEQLSSPMTLVSTEVKSPQMSSTSTSEPIEESITTRPPLQRRDARIFKPHEIASDSKPKSESSQTAFVIPEDLVAQFAGSDEQIIDEYNKAKQYLHGEIRDIELKQYQRIAGETAMNNLSSLASDPLGGITSAPSERANTRGLHIQVKQTQKIDAEKKETLQTSVRLKS